MAFTSTLGDHAAMWGNIMLGATSGVVTIRWTGPFGAMTPFRPYPFSANDTTQVSYRQAAQVAGSDPPWWRQP